jgi:Zn-dependent alcohol dehydrogenase
VAWRDAPEADLLLEVVGHEGAGVVVAVNRSGFAGGCNS